MSGSVGVRVTEGDLGSGWRTLHEAARRRRRDIDEQIVVWLQYAAALSQDGVDAELSRARLDELLGAGAEAA